MPWQRLGHATRTLMVEVLAWAFVFYSLSWLLLAAWRELRRDRRARIEVRAVTVIHLPTLRARTRVGTVERRSVPSASVEEAGVQDVGQQVAGRVEDGARRDRPGAGPHPAEN